MKVLDEDGLEPHLYRCISPYDYAILPIIACSYCFSEYTEDELTENKCIFCGNTWSNFNERKEL